MNLATFLKLSRTTYPELKANVQAEGGHLTEEVLIRAAAREGGLWGRTRGALTPSRDFCPASYEGHRFSDFSHWGEKHPKCERCGFLDLSRNV